MLILLIFRSGIQVARIQAPMAKSDAQAMGTTGTVHRLDHGQRPGRELRVFISLPPHPVVQGGHDAEIDIHRLERRHGLVGDIQPQRPDGRLPGKVRRR